MSYSYYEVFTNAQRAFSGLGFPYGADEDAAYIISWLEAFELDGIHLFSSIQKKIDSNFNGALDNNKLLQKYYEDGFAISEAEIFCYLGNSSLKNNRIST